MRTRTFVAVGVLVALLLAGVASHFASSSPDGLERVAEDQGFSQTAKRHPGGDGPMADYSVKGVEDDRLAGGLAGVVGSLVVLVLAGGLILVVRRRGGSPDDTAGRDHPVGTGKGA